MSKRYDIPFETHPRDGKIFDGEKGRIAAEVMQNHRRRG